MLVDAFTWGTVIGMVGAPLAVVGALIGAFVTWKAGPMSRVGKVLLVTLALTLGLGGHLAKQMLEARSRYGYLFRSPR